MKVPKYVIELMNRSRYNWLRLDRSDYAVGYTIDIEKESYYKKIETLQKEILRLKKWVERQGGEIAILYMPARTEYKCMQYATVTIYDPVMKHIEQYIERKV